MARRFSWLNSPFSRAQQRYSFGSLFRIQPRQRAAGKTGLTNTSFTVNKVYVARDDDGNAGGTAVSLTAATKGTWSSGGIVEKDSTNMPGVYEFGLTNASLLTGSRSAQYLFIGTGIVPCPVEIEYYRRRQPVSGVRPVSCQDDQYHRLQRYRSVGGCEHRVRSRPQAALLRQ